jgi:hypothetical protein
MEPPRAVPIGLRDRSANSITKRFLSVWEEQPRDLGRKIVMMFVLSYLNSLEIYID